MKKINSLIVVVLLAVLCGCGNIKEKAAKIADQAKEEQQQSSDDDLLPPAPNTEVDIHFAEYSDQDFTNVYRHKANVKDKAMFIWMTLDNDDYDDQHIALTFTLNFSEVGEYALDINKNGNLFEEIDGLSFRSAEGNAQITINSMADGFIEGTFSAENVARSNAKDGDELISIKPSSFKLPMKDMRSR